MKIISWNVNGIRACAKKGFKDFIDEHAPDVLFIQETKCAEADLPDELGTLTGINLYGILLNEKGIQGLLF